MTDAPPKRYVPSTARAAAGSASTLSSISPTQSGGPQTGTFQDE